MGELTLQLLVARPAAEVECPVLERRLHRATGLAAMGAVVEAAARRQLLNVRERLAEPVRRFPELELANPRRVEDESALRQEYELPVSRRVTALAVGLADLTHRQ